MALHKAIKFYNPTDQDFVGVWDGEPYPVPAKSSILVTSYVAEHFAKHLANRILQEKFNALCKEHEVTTTPLTRSCVNCKLKSQKLESIYTCPERAELYKQMLIDDSVQKPPVAPENKVPEEPEKTE